MNDKDDKVLMRDLMNMKKEMEIEAGKVETESAKKTSVLEQEKFIKMIKQKKQQKEEQKEKMMQQDISKYSKVLNFTELENISEIIEIAKEKVWREPRNLQYINILMSAYMITNDLKKAEIEYKKGLALERNNIDFLYNSAYFQLLNGKLKEAGEIINKILKIDNDVDSVYLMALLFYVEGTYEKVIPVINKAVLNDKKAGRLYQNLLFIVLMSGTREKQIEVLGNLIEEDGKNIGARVVLEDLEILSGDIESYINQERMIKKIRENIEVSNMPCIHVNRAMYYRKTRKYREAEDELNSAEKYYPNCICGKTERIKLYIQQKKYDEIYGSVVSGLKMDVKFIPLLVELLKLCYYLRKDDKIKNIIDEILSATKTGKIIIYGNNDEIISEIKLEDIRENFIESLNKYKDIMSNFEVEAGNVIQIYKLFRNIKLCSMREKFLNDKI